MKLLPSLKRELTLLSRSVYFYSEIAMAVLCLIVLLVLMPEQFDRHATEYTFIDLPAAQAQVMEKALFKDLEAEEITLKSRGKEIAARLYTTETKHTYVVDSREDLVSLCDSKAKVGTVLHGPGSKPMVEMHLQGNETARYKSYATLILSADLEEAMAAADRQEVRALEANPRVLSDRQNILPLMLTVNCVLMGILATAAYIVEDKKTKTIKALRVAPTRIGTYLAAKMAAVVLTALATALIIALPVMGGSANYLLLTLAIACGGFFTVAAGALLASFFGDVGKAFASIYVVLVLLMLPAIVSMMPGASDAFWVRLIPSYYVVQSIKAALLNRDATYVLWCSLGFTMGGLLLSAVSVRRYKSASVGVGG